MFKRVFWLIPLFIFLINSVAVAQARHEQESELQTEVSLIWAFPQGSFGDNLNQPAPGIVFSFGGRSPDLPLAFITEIGWLRYGLANNLRIQFQGSNTSAPAVSVVNIEMSSSIFMGHLAARLVPLSGKIEPYVGALLGFKYLVSNIGIEGEALFDDGDTVLIDHDDRLSASSSFNSLALSYGVGVGINIEFFEGPMGLHYSIRTISMQIGVKYLFGAEADYLTEESITQQADVIGFEKFESNTGLLIPKLGIRVGL